MPPARAPAPATNASGRVATAPAESRPSVGPASDSIITEPRDEAAAHGGAASAASAPSSATAVAKLEIKAPAASSTEAATPKHTAEPAVKAAPPVAEGARAQALLEGKTTPAAEGGRFVVQVGAFADAGAARETRLKVEKLGLKTYTQVASTAAGDRIRVRVGPFATRDEADRALAKARSAGLSAVVLTL
jgi:DedD protein